MGKSRQTGIAFLEKDEKRGKPGDKGRELVLGDLRAASEEQTAHAGVSPHRGTPSLPSRALFQHSLHEGGSRSCHSHTQEGQWLSRPRGSGLHGLITRLPGPELRAQVVRRPVVTDSDLLTLLLTLDCCFTTHTPSLAPTTRVSLGRAADEGLCLCPQAH